MANGYGSASDADNPRLKMLFHSAKRRALSNAVVGQIGETEDLGYRFMPPVY